MTMSPPMWKMSNLMFTTDQKLDQGGQEEDAKCCEDPPAWLWRGWQGRFYVSIFEAS